MIKFKTRSLSIDIHNNGIYLFELESATGKTYLGDLLSINATYLYNEGIKYVFIGSVFDYEDLAMRIDKASDNTLVVLDRCDMFWEEEFNDVIERNSERLCILMDIKNIIDYLFDWNEIHIHLTEEGITVND